MNTEDLIILNNFNKFFAEKYLGRIVLYGTGIHTKTLLENVENGVVIGLMDAAKTGKNIYGYKVLSYEEVAAISNPIIVIISRTSVVNIIFRRIRDFCSKQSIPVFDLTGKNLMKLTNQDFSKKDCYSVSKDELIEKIDGAKVVSFDIFDTLLCRRVLRPADVFKIIENQINDNGFSFYDERRKAEEYYHGASDTTIDMIYDRLKINTGLSQDYRNYLLNEELNVEEKLLFPRKDMIDAFYYAIAHDKRVILVSDMYISGEYLEQILKRKGIHSFDGLYVSCDFGLKKEEGLFEKVVEEQNVVPSEMIHIGDSQISDIAAPAALGISTFHIYSTIEMFEQSMYSRILDNNICLSENVVSASFASISFNSPFTGFNECGKIVINNDEKLVELFIAPIIYLFIIWLIRKIYENNIDFVIFPSRDGYLLKSIYDDIKNNYKLSLPDSCYLYSSRRSLLIAEAEEKKDIDFILNVPDSRNYYDIIKERFDIELDKNDFTDGILNENGYQDLLFHCRDERKGYLGYLDKVLPKNRNVNCGYIDFVSIGTCQEALGKLLGKALSGLYFLRRKPNNSKFENLKIDSLFHMQDDFSSNTNVYKYYYFLENILTSYEPSFKKISDTGEIRFYDENRNNEQICILKNCHRRIRKYCMDMFAIIGFDNDLPDTSFFDKILDFFSSDYSTINDSILLGINNVDEFMGKIVSDINR